MAMSCGKKKNSTWPRCRFGKDLNKILKYWEDLNELKDLGIPILLGTSRKSVIGKVLQLSLKRLEGTIATTVLV